VEGFQSLVTSTPTALWKPIFIAGCTATGKSNLALSLAERFNGEIISVDSMQVYRGLDIGTAKPSPQIRQAVPHHLIDVAELTEEFSAGRFVELAGEAVERIQHRGHWPIFCGGTGLYFKAFLEGLGETPAPDPVLRRELEGVPLPVLLDELSQSDPKTYGQIDRSNRRRVVRALEVTRWTGRPFSAQRASWGGAPSEAGPPRLVGLERERSELDARISRRVDQMFANGLIEETAALLWQGLQDNRAAMQAIGYRQVADYLAGKVSREELPELIKSKTRRFARRQDTWFRHQLAVKWLPITGEDYRPLAEQIGREFGAME
jgi:tRNA dimethylallyltransferase